MTDSTRQLRVAFLCSRNKDNRDLPGYIQRFHPFLTYDTPEELQPRLQAFAAAGQPGETTRLYMTINPRNPEKTQRALLHWLIDHPDADLSRIEQKTASLAARKENATERKWLLDYDEDPTLYPELEADIKAIDPTITLTTRTTPHGLAIIANHGFDTRKLDLESKWKNVEIKKDGNLCCAWKTNPL